MRRLLYLSPCFPPQARVGALRPLKFVRHLPSHGWSPVVLCDLGRRDPLDLELLEAIPDSTTVVRDYGTTARRNESRLLRRMGRLHPTTPTASVKQRKLQIVGRVSRGLTAALDRNPELVPLGEHSWDMGHAAAAARRILSRLGCEAILVNAAPDR